MRLYPAAADIRKLRLSDTRKASAKVFPALVGAFVSCLNKFISLFPFKALPLERLGKTSVKGKRIACWAAPKEVKIARK